MTHGCMLQHNMKVLILDDRTAPVCVVKLEFRRRKMKNRHLYRGKRTLTDNMWVYWDGFSGVQPNTVIEEETICQCTGYEGIYEKDIFQCDDEIYIIEWCDYSLSWEAQAIGSSESISLGEFNPDEIVVIGKTAKLNI